jgi:intracellular septation protein A
MFLQVAKPILFDLLVAIIFAGVLFATNNIYLATLLGIAIGVAQFAFQKMRAHAIGPLQWLSLGIVVIFGTTTIITHNPHFIMLKPTIIDFAVGTVFATRHWMEPYLPVIVKEHVSERTISRASFGWAVVMFSFAFANVIVAFAFSPKIWVLYATFVPSAVIVLLFVVQYLAFQALVRKNLRTRPTAQTA